jgi:hypothetical protein
VCPAGTSWDGTQCTADAAPAAEAPVTGAACSGGALWDAAQNQCVCTGGSAWDGYQCACGEGTAWNGSACVTAAAQAEPRQRRPKCRQILLDHGYGLAQLDACKGANDRCVAVMIDHGYGIAQLDLCRSRIDVNCMEDLLARGYGYAQLGSCRK